MALDHLVLQRRTAFLSSSRLGLGFLSVPRFCLGSGTFIISWSVFADNRFFWSRMAVFRFLSACGRSPPFVACGFCLSLCQNNNICYGVGFHSFFMRTDESSILFIG